MKTSRNDSGLMHQSDSAQQPSGRSRRSARGGIVLKLLIGLVVLGAAGAGVAYMTLGSGPDAGQALDTAVVERRAFNVTATANGELRAKTQTILRSELERQAAIVELVEEASRVKTGDVIVRLASDELEAELDGDLLQQEQARAQLITAESALDIQISDNSSALRKAELEVRLAEVELRKWTEGDDVEKTLELQLAVEKGERELDRLTTKLARSEELHKREFLSFDELEKDRLEFIEAQANLKSAKVSLDVYNLYTRVKEQEKLVGDQDEKRAELDRVRRKNESELATKQADLNNARRQLELRDAKVEKLKQQIEKTAIKAPTDGLVVYATSLEQYSWMNNQEPLNVGTQINPNQEIIMLPDTSEMVAVVKVQESLVGRVKAGQKAEVKVDAAQGRTYTGTVESIGLMAQSGGWRDPNVREYEVRIALNLNEWASGGSAAGENDIEKLEGVAASGDAEPGTPAHGLKPSMRAEGKIVLAEIEDSLAVPLQAVYTEGPVQFVYVVKGEKFVQKQVGVGRRSDSFAEIRSGLEAGDVVVLRDPPRSRIVAAKFETPAPGAARGPGGGGPARGRGGPGGPPAGGQPGGQAGAKPANAPTIPVAKPVSAPAS